jgi:hypothetical protein
MGTPNRSPIYGISAGDGGGVTRIVRLKRLSGIIRRLARTIHPVRLLEGPKVQFANINFSVYIIDCHNRPTYQPVQKFPCGHQPHVLTF